MSARVTSAKRLASAWIDRNRNTITELNDCLFSYGEPSLEEYESASLLTKILERAGFAVIPCLSGFETAFMASWGEGEGPVAALHAEYDATPSGSQRSGVAKHVPIVAGAPGHAEGHCANATVMVAAALTAKHAMRRLGIPGRLKLFGAPGEELVVSRPYFVRDGYFDDVDLAFHNHIRDAFYTEVGQTQISLISAEFTFSGETSHAGLTPWLGRDALDAVVLMDVGMAQHREHMQPEMRAHRVITNGGSQPNVITEKAAVWWYFRGVSARETRALFERAKEIADGAALMTRTTLAVDIKSAVWPTRCNRALAHVLDRNMRGVGMPVWTEDEIAFARELQQAAGVRVDGLRTELSPMRGPDEPEMSSNDCGDISWKVPMGRLWFPGSVPNIHFHHWSGGAMLAGSIAHKGILAAAKVLTCSILDCIGDADLRAEIRRTFAEEIGSEQYAPMITLGQKPSARPHQSLMEHFRPLMRPHFRMMTSEFENDFGTPRVR
ncbi:MAG: amidohydrolase [Pseudorhodoplanes sp.]|uniref:amidohydrolase n=1 Tax=Pseudorhodoplanes sp. TaxID=1934341 RepID=UPI003D0B71C5